MIVRILACGTSFKGLAAYLTHDPDAETDERVAWTHTLNLANDHVPSAVDEMLWTARNAELLKMEAGIRAGGRATESAVKHVSLNWSPEDDPTRAHMIDTADDFLRMMKWQGHQALLVAHDDKEHPHVHIMLNTIHPETGLKLDDAFEQRRASEWALDYERTQGRIYCEQRLLDPAEREDAPTRPAWMAFQGQRQEFARAENMLRENEPAEMSEAEKSKIANFADWKMLKQLQREEREAFFSEGKAAFSDLRKSVYREIREEYRERWGDYFAAIRDGADPENLAAMKTDLVAEQAMALEMRRDEACRELREARDIAYRELLDGQKEIRASLRARQEAGLDNALFLHAVEDRNVERNIGSYFRAAADETTARPFANIWDSDVFAPVGQPRHERSGLRSGGDVALDVGADVGFGLISFLEGIADGFVGANPTPRPRPAESDHSPAPNPFDAVIEEARKQQQREHEAAADEWYRRQRSLSGD